MNHRIIPNTKNQKPKTTVKLTFQGIVFGIFNYQFQEKYKNNISIPL